MKHRLAMNNWGPEERQAILDVVDSGNITMGEKTSEVEQAYADWVGTKYCVACNSGSSANLLMVAAFTLRNPPVEKFRRNVVLVPAVSWPTSYYPFLQYGWTVKFIDIDRETLNFDIEALKRNWTGDELILAVNLLGNPNEFSQFPSMNVLEDNCESMGAEYGGIRTGNFGVMASHSTYFSHHMNTGEGGFITTDDEYYYHMLLCLRSHGWTRHLPEKNQLDAKVEAFNFILPGYNLRPTDIQSAVAAVQLKKLDRAIANRRRNAEMFPFKLQQTPHGGVSSYYGFPLFAEDLGKLKIQLDERGIEHRPIMSGNFTRLPVIGYFDYAICRPIDNADYVHDHGVFIGNHSHLIDWSILEGVEAEK